MIQRTSERGVGGSSVDGKIRLADRTVIGVKIAKKLLGVRQKEECWPCVDICIELNKST